GSACARQLHPPGDIVLGRPFDRQPFFIAGPQAPRPPELPPICPQRGAGGRKEEHTNGSVETAHEASPPECKRGGGVLLGLLPRCRTAGCPPVARYTPSPLQPPSTPNNEASRPPWLGSRRTLENAAWHCSQVQRWVEASTCARRFASPPSGHPW